MLSQCQTNKKMISLHIKRSPSYFQSKNLLALLKLKIRSANCLLVTLMDHKMIRVILFTSINYKKTKIREDPLLSNISRRIHQMIMRGIVNRNRMHKGIKYLR